MFQLFFYVHIENEQKVKRTEKHVLFRNDGKELDCHLYRKEGNVNS